MAAIKVILYLRSQKKDGTHPVVLSLSHKTETAYIGLGISINENQWNGTEVINHTSAKKYNLTIKTRTNQAESIILRLSMKMNGISLKELKYFLETNDTIPEPKPEYFLDDHFSRYIANTPNPRTKEIYQETLTKIHTFATGISFDQVNFAWLKSFDTHMTISCATNTRAIHMRNIRAVFNDAINEDLIEQNLYPFRKFKIKKEKTIKRSLTVDQIKQIRDYPVQEHQEKYRDLFMLIFYLIGINIVDLLRLKKITNGRIEYKRAKTKRLYSIEVLPEAMVVIEKYRGVTHLLDVMDAYTNYKDFAARMNENLKEIGFLEWIPNKSMDKKFLKKNKKKITPLFPGLSTYWARHSWATIAGKLEIPKETIAAALGHGGNDTTSIYIDFDLKKIDKANRDVINAIL